jgi:hypothetical protein
MTLRRNPQVEAAPLKGEMLLFNGSANKFFVMNASAAFLWDQLQEPAAEDTLAARMCESFSGVGVEQARADIRAAVTEMVSLGLLIDEAADAPGATP